MSIQRTPFCTHICGKKCCLTKHDSPNIVMKVSNRNELIGCLAWQQLQKASGSQRLSGGELDRADAMTNRQRYSQGAPILHRSAAYPLRGDSANNSGPVMSGRHTRFMDERIPV
ncbi:hypothetical protein NDU88_001819 [Pleurodeles waltl]|uniref:Uncharacterized protein n=1 Tax=Pleurodeles waltl TaxID=8319 RepID=A0AAV7MM16_PLEWA|nr:hypothetical protein NDU88_001819 [Pleurodeles waltl]